jgi:hypothetical protein
MRRINKLTAAGVYLPEGRLPIIPIFQYSIIPVVSEANLCSNSNGVQQPHELGACGKSLFPVFSHHTLDQWLILA